MQSFMYVSGHSFGAFSGRALGHLLPAEPGSRGPVVGELQSPDLNPEQTQALNPFSVLFKLPFPRMSCFSQARTFPFSFYSPTWCY